MDNFEITFYKGQRLTYIDVPFILKCTSIDFGHVYWPHNLYGEKSCINIPLLMHLIDNVIDINVCDNNNKYYHTLFTGIINFAHKSNRRYMLNNRGISITSFESMYNYPYNCLIHKKFYKKLEGLVIYLTSISLNKFTKFYNIHKYHDTINTMLLIIKVQTILPSSVIKHLIIPFVYQ